MAILELTNKPVLAWGIREISLWLELCNLKQFGKMFRGANIYIINQGE
jgi:hypothetical protein